MIFVTHFTVVANFQFLHKRYIVERKLHWYSEAFEFHENQPMVNTMLGPSYIPEEFTYLGAKVNKEGGGMEDLQNRLSKPRASYRERR